MIIMKFGGTSVGSAQGIRRIRELAAGQKRVVIVVSAFSRVTDMLVSIAHDVENSTAVIDDLRARHTEVIRELWPDGNTEVEDYLSARLDDLVATLDRPHSKARQDMILATGETLSSFIVSHYIAEERPAEQLVTTACVITNDDFGNAEVIDAPTRTAIALRVSPLLDAETIVVATGFIGATEDGRTTTLGRGGSDYTAALLGYYLEAREVQIWTDVDGVFSSDPRKVTDAVLLSGLTYHEAGELAAFGAKVIHPKTMRPAVHAGIPLRILNTHGTGQGTLISNTSESHTLATAVASKPHVVMVTVHAVEMLHERGFLARIAGVFATKGISVDIVSATETSVSVTLDNDQDLKGAIHELETFSDVVVRDDVGLVSLIGSQVTRPNVMQQIFERLSKINLETAMVSVGAMGINVSLVVDANRVNEAVVRMHELCRRSI